MPVRAQRTKVETCRGCNYELVSDAPYLGQLSDEFFRRVVLAGVEYKLVSETALFERRTNYLQSL
jgi:hypothetical protein